MNACAPNGRVKISCRVENLRYEVLAKTDGVRRSNGALVLSMEHIGQLLYICKRFRNGSYSSKVMKLLKPGNMLLPQLFVTARVVTHFKPTGA